MTIFKIGDPSLDDVLQKMNSLFTEKMTPATKSPKWIKSITITDQTPDILPDKPQISIFTIDLSVSGETKNSPSMRSTRRWIWSQIPPSGSDTGEIYIKSDPNYLLPALFSNPPLDSSEPLPHTWTILIEYGDGSKRLETRTFSLGEKGDLMLATIFHGNIHIYVYLQLVSSSKRPYHRIIGLALINTKAYRSLPQSILPVYVPQPVSIFAPNHINNASKEMRVPPLNIKEMTLSPPIPFDSSSDSGENSPMPISPISSGEVMSEQQQIPLPSPLTLESEESSTTMEPQEDVDDSSSTPSSTSSSTTKRSQVTSETVEAPIESNILLENEDLLDDFL